MSDQPPQPPVKHTQPAHLYQQKIERLEAERDALAALIEQLAGDARACAEDYSAEKARADRMEGALRLIAAPKRPDGTWNRCREACRLLAEAALEAKP